VAQEHRNLQIVVQDGASGDGTLEVLRRFGERLDLVTAADRDQNDAFLRGLARCRGDVIGFCWADEELLPHAVRRGVAVLGEQPELAAVYGDIVETDLAGVGEKTIPYPDWSFERVFTYEFIPPVCASFFRRDRLEETYGHLAHLGPECTEYLLWVSVGSRYPVAHVAEPLARYARHRGQLSMRPERMAAYAPRLAATIDRLAGCSSLPPIVRDQRERAIANVHLWAAQWLHEACGDPGAALQQLTLALDHHPDPAWLATVAWNAIRHSLASREPAAIEAWLDVLERGGFRIVGHEYARYLASLETGSPVPDPSTAAAAIGDDPDLAAFWRLVPEIVRAVARGAPGTDDPALEVLEETARRRPDAWFPLSLALADLGRHDRAAVAADRHLSRSPNHEAGRRWADQLGLIRCAQDEKPRRRIAAARGREGALSLEEATQVADLVWRLLADPDLGPRLPAASRTVARGMVAALRATASERGMSELGASLAQLEPNLA
jgi:hypothetical protein